MPWPGLNPLGELPGGQGRAPRLQWGGQSQGEIKVLGEGPLEACFLPEVTCWLRDRGRRAVRLCEAGCLLHP